MQSDPIGSFGSSVTLCRNRSKCTDPSSMVPASHPQNLTVCCHMLSISALWLGSWVLLTFLTTSFSCLLGDSQFPVRVAIRGPDKRKVAAMCCTERGPFVERMCSRARSNAADVMGCRDEYCLKGSKTLKQRPRLHFVYYVYSIQRKKNTVHLKNSVRTWYLNTVVKSQCVFTGHKKTSMNNCRPCW